MQSLMASGTPASAPSVFAFGDRNVNGARIARGGFFGEAQVRADLFVVLFDAIKICLRDLERGKLFIEQSVVEFFDSEVVERFHVYE